MVSLNYCGTLQITYFENNIKELKTTQNLNQQNNAEILCKNDYALSF